MQLHYHLCLNNSACILTQQCSGSRAEIIILVVIIKVGAKRSAGSEMFYNVVYLAVMSLGSVGTACSVGGILFTTGDICRLMWGVNE